MSFEYPYAFLVLLAIPVLIVIYILKNKYKETTAPSTYLWEMSKQFLKKKKPFHSIQHLLSLILQCVTIFGLSICLAHPNFIMPGKSDNILFILDSSASMNMREANGETCFDKAKGEIEQIVDKSTKGSSYSLLVSGEENRIVCKDIQDKNQFSLYLSSLNIGCQRNDLSSCLTKAQEIVTSSNINSCYLLTDKKMNNLTDITLIDCSTDQDNYALSDLSYEYDDNQLKISASVLSYMSDKNLTVNFYCNDVKIGSRKYLVTKGDPYIFAFNYNDTKGKYKDISSIKAEIEEKDALDEDNTAVIYNNNESQYSKILLVSDEPFYLKSIFSAINNASDYKNEMDVVSKSAYTPNTSYDLYIFDSYTPASLPKNGSLMFFNSDTTLTGTGFIAQKEIEEDSAVHLTYADNSSSLLYQNLTKGIVKNDITVKKYIRYSLSSSFTTIMSYDNIPFVFAGKSDNGQREIVFSFDLHNSNLPVQYDFSPLMRNALGYLSPRIVEKYNYEVHDQATLNISDNIREIVVKTPSDRRENLRKNNDYLVYSLDELGTYVVTVTFEDDSTKNIYLSALYPDDESNPLVEDVTPLSLVIDSNAKKGNGIFDNILPFIIFASVVFLLDWGVYAYEQY